MAKFDYWLSEEGLARIAGWTRDGAIDKDIAAKCGVAYSTFRGWRDKFPALSAALKEGKEVVDLLVENALLKRALGYTYEEKTYERKQITEEGDTGMVLTKTVTKEVIPDTTAQIFWLKNRKKAEWRDNAERLEMEREKLELAKRLTDAQIAKINSDIGADDTEFVIGFDEEIETNGWSK